MGKETLDCLLAGRFSEVYICRPNIEEIGAEVWFGQEPMNSQSRMETNIDCDSFRWFPSRAGKTSDCKPPGVKSRRRFHKTIVELGNTFQQKTSSVHVIQVDGGLTYPGRYGFLLLSYLCGISAREQKEFLWISVGN